MPERHVYDRWWAVEGSGFATVSILHAAALFGSLAAPDRFVPQVGAVLAMPLYLVAGLALGWTLGNGHYRHFDAEAPFAVPRLGVGAAVFAGPIGLLTFGPVMGLGYCMTAWFLVFAGGLAGVLHEAR